MRRLWLRHILLESQCRCHKRKRTEALGPWQKMSRNETTPQEDKQKLQRKRAQDTKTLRYETTNWVLIKIRYLGQLQSPINRESTAIPTVSYPTLFCAETCQNMTRYLADMAWARAYSCGLNNRGSTADQSRISSTRHFLKIEMIWFMRLWTLLFGFFFAIGYHYWTQFPNKPEWSEYKSENNLSGCGHWCLLLQ